LEERDKLVELLGVWGATGDEIDDFFHCCTFANTYLLLSPGVCLFSSAISVDLPYWLPANMLFRLSDTLFLDDTTPPYTSIGNKRNFWKIERKCSMCRITMIRRR
jgi:hypothetical protein